MTTSQSTQVYSDVLRDKAAGAVGAGSFPGPRAAFRSYTSIKKSLHTVSIRQGFVKKSLLLAN